tara:strand:+ start:58 stop:735 length:678 start_codon:yes stop_codon:yes gene_type:complete
MKKEEIKADPIRDRIVSGAQYIAENSSKFWTGLGVVILLIMTASYMSNQSDQELNSQNLKLGLIMNDLIHDRTIEDTIVYNDLEESLSDFGNSEMYSQAFILLLSKAVSDNNTSKVSSLLENNNFDSDDDLLNGYYYKLLADIESDKGNLDKSIKYYEKAVDVVPSFDLKVDYSVSLIELLLSDNQNEKAKGLLDEIKEIDSSDLSSSSRNNLDFIESKLLHIVK